MYCEKCEKEHSPKSLTHTIWDFDPYSYTDFSTFKEDLYSVIQRTSLDGLFSWNEDGLTYTQYHIWYLSVKKHSVRKFKPYTIYLFKCLKDLLHPYIFKYMLLQGKKEDFNHTTFHHYLKHLEFPNPGRELLSLFDSSFMIYDKDGKLPYDYRKDRFLSKEDHILVQEFTKIYKTAESECQRDYRNLFTRCEKCDECIYFLQEIDRIPDRKKLETIVKYRKYCKDIFKKYSSENIDERHQHVIQIYENVLNSCIVN